ncbi:DUF6461 domain-containing protein [Actinoplanes sp. L3-i22]|uniref:DUF6461 domain-containing protein n=1 Tax=Actinoplanes sp. L3-i22 TaxID=2836373 RepID=UPI0021052900|nr:DUF6461 domain-containing protein [Actinoplanes sp. L3-i22]
MTLASLAGCGRSRAVLELADSDEGHLWAKADGPLGRGFCLTLVRGLRPVKVARAIGGKSHETVYWAQLVGPGDGEEGGGRYFLGLAGFDDWTLILEDGGDGGLGMDTAIVGPLSEGRSVLAYRGDAMGRGNRRTYRDGRLETDVMDHTSTAISYLEGQIGFKLTGALLESKTYLLVTVPKV